MNSYYLKYYSNFNYFQNIVKTIQSIRLSEIEESYLRHFVYHRHYSPYDIEPNKKMQDEKGDVKSNSNAYTRAKISVRKLYKLKLIKLDKKKEKNPHKKKNYSLTAIGLFYIIRLPTFLSIDIQVMIKNYPNFRIFKDLLYPFIKLGTLRSANIPIDILNTISLYIQKYYLEIENFISYTKNKNDDWNGTYWNWNTEKLRKYLIDKYKYKWLKNAETKENSEKTILKFFNKNKRREYIDIRLEEDKTSAYLINGTKKKKKDIIPKIEAFLIKFHFSKEEMIGRAFSNYYTIKSSKFVFSLLSASTSFTRNISILFSKDENFIQSLETAKEDFDNFYLAVKNPYQYSLESLIKKDLWEIAYQRSKDDMNAKLTS